MKTRNKILALVEVAIVLCSLFLVAIPAIAAEQNQEMQKVSASEVTTASEDDYVLGVYGNANEDDTIDMRDLTYVKLIFFGKKPETELSDAKYDGKINPLDFIQIKLIIVGKEKEITIVDDFERIVTIDMPLERMVSIAGSFGPEAFCALGAGDRLVGVGAFAKLTKELDTCLENIPGITGYGDTLDMEMILELNPQIVHAYAIPTFFPKPKHEEALNAAGIKLFAIDFHRPKTYYKAIRTMGYILHKQERAEELINFEQQHRDLIKERVNDLTDEQKVRVYYSNYPYYYGPTKTKGKNTPAHDKIELCGGINIFADVEGSMTVDPEAVIERNPQVIIANTHSGAKPGALGYGITDTSSVEEVRNTIMNYPGWDQIDAVKSGRVYFICSEAASTHDSVYLSYMAKYFYPELFEDIDPEAIHAEWFQKFLGIEYKGVYAYPPPESW